MSASVVGQVDLSRGASEPGSRKPGSLKLSDSSSRAVHHRKGNEYPKGATRLAECDRVCDYSPIAPLTNLIDLFLKVVYMFLPEAIQKNRYWTHIKEKDTWRCLLLLIPVLGSLCVLVADYAQYRKEKKEIREFLEKWVGLPHLRRVTLEQMGPAPTEKERRLWNACFTKDVETVRELLEEGVKPNFYQYGLTPLGIACASQGSLEIVKLLVKDPESDRASRSDFATLAEALVAENTEVAQFLVERISDIDAVLQGGMTPLMFASLLGNQILVKEMIAKGADIRKSMPDGGDALSLAIVFDHPALLHFLIERGEQIDARRYTPKIPVEVEGSTPLLLAALVGSVNSGKYLIPYSDVRCQDSSGSNALHYAVRHVELLKALLGKCDTSAFVNQKNKDGNTPLHLAIALGKFGSFLDLLRAGADPLIANEKGQTPLSLAGTRGLMWQEKVCEKLEKERRMTSEIKTEMDFARRGVWLPDSAVLPDVVGNNVADPMPDLRRSVKTALSFVPQVLDLLKERILRQTEERKKLGEPPRTGMELILGKLREPPPIPGA